MTLKIYNYHPHSGEYLGASLADPSPLEADAWLLPAHATTRKPPQTRAQEVAVFRQGKWQRQADWRAVSLFSTTDGSPVRIDTIGSTPADVGATPEPRPSAAHVWRDNAWVLDDAQQQALLETARTQALASLEDEYAQAAQRLLGQPSQAEKDSWALKQSIARALLEPRALDEIERAFLAASHLRTARAQTTWARKVMRKVSQRATLLGQLEQLRYHARVVVSQAQSVAQLASALAAARQDFAEAAGADKKYGARCSPRPRPKRESQ